MIKRDFVEVPCRRRKKRPPSSLSLPSPYNVQGSLEDKAMVAEAMAGIDVVIHVAALVNYWFTYDFELDVVDRVNFHGTKTLLDAAKAVSSDPCLAPSACALVWSWPRC